MMPEDDRAVTMDQSDRLLPPKPDTQAYWMDPICQARLFGPLTEFGMTPWSLVPIG